MTAIVYLCDRRKVEMIDFFLLLLFFPGGISFLCLLKLKNIYVTLYLHHEKLRYLFLTENPYFIYQNFQFVEKSIILHFCKHMLDNRND